VQGADGRVSLQIVEKAQVDSNDPDQKEILETSTHFNPVILVCCTKSFRGDKYALRDFIDPETYFISEKSMNGKPLKALEHPGLWNGAMANWLTVFVEIPASTFTPVQRPLEEGASAFVILQISVFFDTILVISIIFSFGRNR